MGWFPTEQSGKLDPEATRFAANAHSLSSEKRVNQNYELLIDSIRLCKARNVGCVLVSTPTHRLYRELLAPDCVEETKRLVAQAVASTQASYLDYSDDPRFFDEDFFDCTHLNPRGAVKFTKIFDADLAALKQTASLEEREN
jgi:hypothetical protein